MAFLITAALYASVGFGGGSTYTALLVLVGTDYRLVPVISLVCNLIVVTGGTLAFARRGWLRLGLALPLVATSVPMAWLGGVTPIGRQAFLAVLGVALLASGTLLLFPAPTEDRPLAMPSRARRLLAPVVGAGLGYLAGLVGIGGGIFLAPLLHVARAAHPKTIAATASFFILVNSAAGLLGQWHRLGPAEAPLTSPAYVGLWAAVLVGGQVGSHVSLRVLRPVSLRRLTGALVVYVGARLCWAAVAGASSG